MVRRVLGLVLVSALASSAPAVELVHTVGKLTILADTRFAFPGGLLVVRLRRSLGTTYAVFDGRRAPFFESAHGPRALLPIPVSAEPGPGTLGIELLTRRGRQRIPMDVSVAPRSYPSRTAPVPAQLAGLLTRPGSLTDGRRLLMLLRTETPEAQWTGPFVPPVAGAPAAGFGVAETVAGGVPVDRMMDGSYEDYHRGADYDVPAGTPVRAPAAGTVLLAGPLTLSGETLVLDHGQGVVSAFFHLQRVAAREGDRVQAGAVVAASGSSGLAAAPHLHWAVYVHGVAVDPAVFEKLDD